MLFDNSSFSVPEFCVRREMARAKLTAEFQVSSHRLDTLSELSSASSVSLLTVFVGSFYVDLTGKVNRL